MNLPAIGGILALCLFASGADAAAQERERGQARERPVVDRMRAEPPAPPPAAPAAAPRESSPPPPSVGATRSDDGAQRRRSGSRERGERPAGRSGDRSDGNRRAVPRGSVPDRSVAGADAAASDGGKGTSAETGRDSGRRDRDRVVAPYSRPRGDRPVTGVAVPRTARPSSAGPVIIYNPWGYGRNYGYGYGSFGLGYFYYDPYWYDPYYWGYPYGSYGYGSYGSYSQGSYGSSLDTGALKLKVKPREAQVFVDGYYVGVVDDFDGIFQKLQLDSGAHRIEIRAEGYEPLAFDVRIEFDETITYRGELQKLTR